MVNINKSCILDEDCDKGTICAFDEKDFSNYCISNNINDLYYGCINDNIENNLESIENKSNNDTFNFTDCINFSRRQINKDNLEYNYMIYKPKKNVFVDTTTINIYLKCEDEILAIIPYGDYFNLKCDDNQQNCILESKESLLNFIIQNTKNCDKKIYLEIIYECENEGLKKSKKIPIYLDNFIPIEINLTCPIDNNNEKFKSKCESIYINEYDTNNYENIIDSKKKFNECKNPLFKVPRIVKNINNYKKLKSNYSKNELKDYDKKINEKIEDLKKLEAEKYMRLKKIKNNVDISFEDSYKKINANSTSNSFNKLTNDAWKIYKNYDAAQNLYEENEKNKVLTYYGKVYTLDDAMRIAEENDQNYFVWYHNSYELDDFASKLYFIDVFFGEQNLLKKKNWVKHENVTTCVSQFDIETFIDKNDIDDSSADNENLVKIKKIFKESGENNSKLNNEIGLFINKNMHDLKNIHNNIIKYLDDKITTYGQAISMNNYETNINNTIILVLSGIFGMMILISVMAMGYFNYKYAGKLTLFGR